MSSEEVEIENQFNRLPNDVVLIIFNKLFDAKWLLRCSVVSKRFASLSPRVHSVFVSFPHWKSPSPTPCYFPDQSNFPKNLFNFIAKGFVAKPFQRLYHLVAATKPPLPPPYTEGPRLLSLGQFKGIQSLQFEFPPHCNIDVGPKSLFKWGAKFGTKLETFTFLCLTSLHRMNNGNPFETEELGITNNELKHRVSLAINCLQDAMLRHAMLVSSILIQPMLESMVVTDTKKWGARIRVSGERLLQLRELVQSAPSECLWEGMIHLNPKMLRGAHLPVLHLPLSGFVAKDATLVMIDFVDRNGDDDDAAVIASFAADEEHAFGEAVEEILTNHKEKVLPHWSRNL